MSYQPDYPPIYPDQLPDYLLREFQRIAQELDELRDGILQNAVTEPPGDRPTLFYSDGSYDFGAGEGLYLRIGTVYYKLTMVAFSSPSPGNGITTVVGNIPTVTTP